jgi:hypothetical protein
MATAADSCAWQYRRGRGQRGRAVERSSENHCLHRGLSSTHDSLFAGDQCHMDWSSLLPGPVIASSWATSAGCRMTIDVFCQYASGSRTCQPNRYRSWVVRRLTFLVCCPLGLRGRRRGQGPKGRQKRFIFQRSFSNPHSPERQRCGSSVAVAAGGDGVGRARSVGPALAAS